MSLFIFCVLVSFFVLPSVNAQTEPDWKKLVATDGSTYDLSPMGTNFEDILFQTKNVWGEDRYYHFAIARPMKAGCGFFGPCQNAGTSAFCQSIVPTSIWSQICIAAWQPNLFKVTPQTGGAGVNIDFPKVLEGNYQTKVIIKCDKKELPTSFGVISVQDSEPNFEITIASFYGCPVGGSGSDSGISLGSILLILLFVGITVYIIAGVLFNKFKKGESGMALVPNVEFWTKLPGLVKDGAVFLFNRGRLPQSI
eukprot:TRINITY_DN908_c0_g1_i1.p1 TRINITY_DN908_c0_g1~~TRINITY_DN908_c0_g1_i1.p1  ORF type:complete len:253 (+),score=39.12 TRINITY_DN908_c0_g1_i1:55-813(+)